MSTLRLAVALLVLGALLSTPAAHADGQAWPRRLLEAPGRSRNYSNLLTAAQREVEVINMLYNGVFREKGWARTPDFKPLLSVALNPHVNITAFFPADESWKRVADYYCLTQQAVLDNISNLPTMLANYIKLHLVPNTTLFSSGFRDGLVLNTMRDTNSGPAMTQPMGRDVINGTEVWVFKNASIFFNPDTQSYEDVVVNPARMDITAGKGSVIHVINTMFRDAETERFWNGLRSQVLARAGLPPDSKECPSENPLAAAYSNGSAPPGSMAPSQVAGIVIGIVLGVLLLGVGVLLLISRRHSGKGGKGGGGASGSLKQLDSLRQLSWSRKGGGGGGGAGSCKHTSGSRGLTPPLLPPGTIGSSSHHSGGNGLTAPLVHSGSGSLSTSSGGAGSTQQLACADHMSVVAEEGRSAAPFASSSHAHTASRSGGATLPAGGALAAAAAAAAAAGGAAGSNAASAHGVGSRQASVLPDTPSSSCGNTPTHRGGGGGGCLRSVASGSSSDQDALSQQPAGGDGAVGTAAAAAAAAAAVAAAAAAGFGLVNAADRQFHSSLSSAALGATGSVSVAVGRINQEHVIPLSELQLRELIGSGAEGKVYRGTWKHTDIAAKEYLPIEPHSASAAAKSADEAPSEAAMASARAALAKEVHWLTSLNHPNLVRFCAVCLERPLVVMEFYKHGSVFALLQKASRQLAALEMAAAQREPGAPLPDLSPRKTKYISYFNWDRRLEMLHDVAAGMSYLHGKDHIHGDLRSPNLFVGADGKVKIGDFGFTKRLSSNRASLKVKRITHPRWVAPELMIANEISRACDVYSFGVIMFELLTFQIPFDPLTKEQVVISVMQGARPIIPGEEDLPPGTSSSTCLATFIRLMRDCWAQDAAQRPSFEVIARRLKAMQRWRMLIARHATLQRAASAVRRTTSSCTLSRTPSSHLHLSRLMDAPTPTPVRSKTYGALAKSSSVDDFERAAAAAAAAAGAGAPAAGAAASALNTNGSVTTSGHAHHHVPVSSLATNSATTGLSNGSCSMLDRTRSSRTDASTFSTPRRVSPPAGSGAPGARHRRGLSWAGAGSASALGAHQLDHLMSDAEDDGFYDDDEQLPGYLDDLEDADAALQATSTGPGAFASIPVSEAIVRGTRLAVIGVDNPQQERDALASTCPELAAAKQVLLVTSDLPTGQRPFSRQALKCSSSSGGVAGSAAAAAGAASPDRSLQRASVGLLPANRSNGSFTAVQDVQRSVSDTSALQSRQAATDAVAHVPQQPQQQQQQPPPPQQQQQLDPAPRQAHQQQQQQQAYVMQPFAAATATVTAAASALAAAAAGVGGWLSGQPWQQQQLRGQGSAPDRLQHQQGLPVMVLQGAAAAAAMAAATRQSGLGIMEQPRRHSEPLPAIQPHWTAGAGGVVGHACDSGNLLPPASAAVDDMSSGQSPFAVVHVAQPGLDASGDLHQQQQQQQQQQHPLVQQQWKSNSTGHMQLQQQQQHHHHHVLVQPQVILVGDQLLPQQWQRLQQQQQQEAPAHPQQQAAAPAGPVEEPWAPEDAEAEMYTTFDSPFYLGTLCAHSASSQGGGGGAGCGHLASPVASSRVVSSGPASGAVVPGAALPVSGVGVGAEQQSFRVATTASSARLGCRISAAAAAAIVAAVGREEDDAAFVQRQQSLAAAAAAGDAAAAAGVDAADAGGPFATAGAGGSLSSSLPLVLTSSQPLNQALTIEYNADMTPLAAAAAAALTVHPPPARRATAAGSQPRRLMRAASALRSPFTAAPAAPAAAAAEELRASGSEPAGSATATAGSRTPPAATVLCVVPSEDSIKSGAPAAVAAAGGPPLPAADVSLALAHGNGGKGGEAHDAAAADGPDQDLSAARPGLLRALKRRLQVLAG